MRERAGLPKMSTRMRFLKTSESSVEFAHCVIHSLAFHAYISDESSISATSKGASEKLRLHSICPSPQSGHHSTETTLWGGQPARCTHCSRLDVGKAGQCQKAWSRSRMAPTHADRVNHKAFSQHKLRDDGQSQVETKPLESNASRARTCRNNRVSATCRVDVSQPAT